MRSKPIVVFVAIGGLFFALMGFAYVTTAGPDDDQILAVGSLIVSATCFLAICETWGRDFLRGPILYFTLFTLFHLGLIWTLGFGGNNVILAISPTARLWVRTPFLSHAVWLCCLGGLAYTAVCLAMRPRNSAEMVEYADSQTGFGPRMGAIGVTLELGGLTFLAATLMSSGGFGLLKGGYVQLLESAQNSGFAYSIWLFGVGACLSQVGSRPVQRMGLLAFCIFAGIFFPIGLRGSVLFPGVVLLATRAMTGRRIKSLYVATVGIGALYFAAFVRLNRVGLDSSPDLAWYSPAISTITELGFSLRPTIEALRWESGGSPHTMFVSFLAVPIRTVEKLTGWHGGPPALDARLFNVKINTLAGPIGGSPIGEGYDAAGIWGVVIIMATLAVLICLVSNPRAITPVSVCRFVVVMIPIAVAVRNSFAPVIVQISLGLAIVYVASLSARRVPSISEATEGVSVAK